MFKCNGQVQLRQLENHSHHLLKHKIVFITQSRGRYIHVWALGFNTIRTIFQRIPKAFLIGLALPIQKHLKLSDYNKTFSLTCNNKFTCEHLRK